MSVRAVVIRPVRMMVPPVGEVSNSFAKLHIAGVPDKGASRVCNRINGAAISLHRFSRRKQEQVRPDADIRADRRTDAGVDGGARADHISSFRRQNAPGGFTAFSFPSVCGSCGRSSGWSRQATNGFKGPARRNRRGFAPPVDGYPTKGGSPVLAHGEAGILSRL